MTQRTKQLEKIADRIFEVRIQLQNIYYCMDRLSNILSGRSREEAAKHIKGVLEEIGVKVD